jgi:hypothetical protein
MGGGLQLGGATHFVREEMFELVYWRVLTEHGHVKSAGGKQWGTQYHNVAHPLRDGAFRPQIDLITKRNARLFRKLEVTLPICTKHAPPLRTARSYFSRRISSGSGSRFGLISILFCCVSADGARAGGGEKRVEIQNIKWCLRQSQRDTRVRLQHGPLSTHASLNQHSPGRTSDLRRAGQTHPRTARLCLCVLSCPRSRPPIVPESGQLLHPLLQPGERSEMQLERMVRPYVEHACCSHPRLASWTCALTPPRSPCRLSRWAHCQALKVQPLLAFDYYIV